MKDDDSSVHALDEWDRAEVGWEKRLAYLEEMAEQFWPGTDTATRDFRTAIVWEQFSKELDWDRFTEMTPKREPISVGPDDLIDAFTIPGIPAMGSEATGFGDHLRAELKRQGTDLDTFCDSLRLTRESIPWEDLTSGSRMAPLERRRWVHHLKKTRRWNRG